MSKYVINQAVAIVFHPAIPENKLNEVKALLVGKMHIEYSQRLKVHPQSRIDIQTENLITMALLTITFTSDSNQSLEADEIINNILRTSCNFPGAFLNSSTFAELLVKAN
jgi:hypothetical protein